MDLRREGQERIQEACAEAQANFAVHYAADAVQEFFAGDRTWHEVLGALSWAAAEGDKARMRGWNFLDQRAA